MAMSDCIMCWDTPCSCGYDYRSWNKERRIAYAAVMLGVEKRDIEKQLGEFILEPHPRYGEK